jgi:hypothetical protein
VKDVKLDEFLEYFPKIFIDTFYPNEQVLNRAVYEIIFWNIFDRAITNKTRTTNSIG